MYRALFILILLVGCGDCDSNNDNSNSNNAADAGDMSVEPDGDVPVDSGLFDPAELGWGLHVIGQDASDIYVAGGTPDRGVLLHFDGSEWLPEDLPDGTPLLNWVKPFDDGQVVAVGNGGTVLWNDGSGWTSQPSGTQEDLWGVWGASPTDVWAVGGRGREDGQATVLRNSARTWAPAGVPALTRPGVNAWFKVWGTGADNVYIVGQNGAVLHWQGAALTELGVGTSEDLISVWGTGPDDILLVGGRGNGVLSHWNGTDWHTDSIAPAPGVNGVWMPAPGEFWLAGVRGMLRRGTVNAEADGSRSFDVPRTPPLTEGDLHAVYGVDGYGLITVGGNFEMQDGPYVGQAFLVTEDWQ